MKDFINNNNVKTITRLSNNIDIMDKKTDHVHPRDLFYTIFQFRSDKFFHPEMYKKIKGGIFNKLIQRNRNKSFDFNGIYERFGKFFKCDEKQAKRHCDCILSIFDKPYQKFLQILKCTFRKGSEMYNQRPCHIPETNLKGGVAYYLSLFSHTTEK